MKSTIKNASKNKSDESGHHAMGARAHAVGSKLHSMTLFPTPEDAFRQGNSLFGAAIILDIFLTFVFIKPDFSHDVTVVAGKYYNICVALDYFPANYIAAIGYEFVQACWWCSCWLFLARAKETFDEGLISRDMLTFVRICGVFFSLTTPVMLLCLMRKPHIESVDSLIFHVRTFESQIVGCGVWVFCQWVFALTVLSKHRPNMRIYSFWTWTFIAACITKIYYHQDTIEQWVNLKHPELASIMPWYKIITSVPQLNDWVWVISLPAVSAWSPLFGWSPSGDYFEEARSVGALNSEYPPYVKVPEEDEAKNAKIAQELADDFETGFQADFKADPENLEEWGVCVGMLRATFEVHKDRVEVLHPDLRVGLLDLPGKHDAIIRVNVTILGTVRMSTRIFLPDGVQTSAMLKANLPAVCLSGSKSNTDYAPVPTSAKGLEEVPKVADMLFAEDLKEFLAPSGEALCALKRLKYKDSAMTALGRALWWLPTLLGLKKAFKVGIERTHPGDVFSALGIFGKSYYGGLPFRLGPGACKWGLEPFEEHNIGEGPDVLPSLAEPTPYKVFAAAVEIQKPRLISSADDFLKGKDAKFHFKVQVAADESRHDFKKANSVWCEDTSPYLTVGTLTIPKGQKMATLQKEIGDGLLFDVFNNLKEHRPVGPLNNARHAVYKAHGGARQAAYKQCPVMGKVSMA